MRDSEEKMSHDDLEVMMEHGIDRLNRRLFLNEISEANIANVIKGIYYFQSVDNKKPIELFISSYGGEMYEMFGLYDVLNTVTCPIVTVAVGKCQSAAPLLVAVGTKGKRYACPNTSFMFHQSSDYEEGEGGASRLGHIETEVKHHREIEERWYKLLAKHSNKTVAFWRSQAKKEGNSYYTAEEALEYGIVDYLWVERSGAYEDNE
jgi:ATP-dependent Clp protease protease subunit